MPCRSQSQSQGWQAVVYRRYRTILTQRYLLLPLVAAHTSDMDVGCGLKELCIAFLCYAVNNSCTNSNFLSSSGGTDIISCFAGQNPTVPVYRGEIQTRNLGMAVESWNDEGKTLMWFNLKCKTIITLSFWHIPSPQICPVSQKPDRRPWYVTNFFDFCRRKEGINDVSL